MYSEKTFKNYIFWIQVKRVVLIILLSCIGASIGVLVSELYESITKSNTFNVLIIVVSTVVMFLLALLCTAGTGKSVQDGYWKIAVLRKLTSIQKSIETNNSLLENKNKIDNILPNKEEIDKVITSAPEQVKEEKNDDIEYEEDVDVQINIEEKIEDIEEEINSTEEKEESKTNNKTKKVKEAV